MRLRSHLLFAFAVLALLGCATNNRPRTVLYTPTPASTERRVVTANARQETSSQPLLVSTDEARQISAEVENLVLDSRRRLTVRDGINLVAQNTEKPFQGWDVYFVKNWATDPNRKIYWAVAKFGAGNSALRAIISVETLASGTILPWGPCNYLADMVMSRVFGGPSYGDDYLLGTRCTSQDGTLASKLVR